MLRELLDFRGLVQFALLPLLASMQLVFGDDDEGIFERPDGDEDDPENGDLGENPRTGLLYFEKPKAIGIFIVLVMAFIGLVASAAVVASKVIEDNYRIKLPKRIQKLRKNNASQSEKLHAPTSKTISVF